MNIPDLKKIIPEDYKNFQLIEEKILKNGTSIHGMGFLGNWVLNDLQKNKVLEFKKDYNLNDFSIYTRKLYDKYVRS